MKGKAGFSDKANDSSADRIRRVGHAPAENNGPARGNTATISQGMRV